MASSQHSLTPTNSTTFDSDSDSSSSSSSLSSPASSSMETQPSRPFFFGRRALAKKNKPGFIMIKKRYPHEETVKESESSPPCVFFITKKKPTSTTDSADSSSAATRKRKEREFDNSFDAAKNKLVNLADTPTESVLETKNSGEEEAVSTELTLFHGFEINSGVSSGSTSRNKSVSDNFLAPNLARFKSCRCGGCDEEQRMGISTELRLYNDPWVIKKRLKGSDIGHLARLLVETKLVRAHILPLVGSVRANQIHTEKGLQVTLLDLDTGSEHQLIFKKWVKPSSYVFISGWREQFVKRRGLQEGDEIGLFWDGYSSRFYFRVLARAAVPLAQRVI